MRRRTDTALAHAWIRDPVHWLTLIGLAVMGGFLVAGVSAPSGLWLALAGFVGGSFAFALVPFLATWAWYGDPGVGLATAISALTGVFVGILAGGAMVFVGVMFMAQGLGPALVALIAIASLAKIVRAAPRHGLELWMWGWTFGAGLLGLSPFVVSGVLALARW